MSLQDQVAIVTGGSRGLGRAISLALAEAGAAIVVNYVRREDEAAKVVAEITAAGGQAVAVQADVGDADGAGKLVQAALDSFGRLDILVNNAGITRDQLMLRLKEEDWDAVLDTNLKGAFHCTKAALRPLLKQRGGRVINISSIVGLVGNAGQANYAAAKAGLIGFTKAVAREVASRGITVNAVCPGYFDTEMTQALPSDVQEAHMATVPFGRFGEAAELASVVTFLAGPGASYVTGQTIAVDGGMTMQ